MVLFTVVSLMMAMLVTSVARRSLARSVKTPPPFARVAAEAKAVAAAPTTMLTTNPVTSSSSSAQAAAQAAAPKVLHAQPLQRRCCLPRRGLLLRLEQTASNGA
jgi:hypothetical protein